MFEANLWNMYERATEELPRTNNSVKGWHRSFLASAGCCHPNIWKFLTFIKREQSLQQVKLAQFAAGFDKEPSRKKYLDVSKQIISIVNTYDGQNVLEYLRRICTI